MVESLWDKGSKRKLRLLAVACCRRIAHLVTDVRYHAVVAEVEGFMEGTLSRERLEAVQAECRSEPRPIGSWLDPQYLAAYVLKHLPYACLHDDPVAHLLDFFSFIQMASAGAQAPVNSEAWQAASGAEEKAECELLRDIFGNPYRPVTFSRSWRTNTAVTLTRQMYDSREFSAMPILADALQDAGCDSADILDHCRGPGPHVRGCWVVDLVLAKE
jgi:hypothetical protein